MRRLVGSLILLGVLALRVESSLAADSYPPWKLGLSFEGVSSDYEFLPVGEPSKKLTLRPAASQYVGVIFGYRWLATTFAFAVPADRETRQREGESRYRDYRVSYFSNRWGFEANYHSFRGYVLENSDRVPASVLAGQTFLKYPDMRSSGVGVNGYHFFRGERFQTAAALDQSEPHTKSGGSWIAILSLRHQSVMNGGGFIPTDLRSEFGAESSLHSLKMTRLGLGPAYGYLLSGYGGFFISPVIGLTPGIQKLEYRTESSARDLYRMDMNLHLKASVGINDLIGFLKLTGTFDIYGARTGSVEMSHSVISVLLTAGARF